ncbi:MAG: molybdopterin-guanine dinucleotide biosynthesis protein B [Atribacterota bacterium]|nr:molybdopterin-guanine dinucleotide biosynthesis protein B [Atribacterota bacterium]
MKAIAIVGFKKSGKTTLAIAIAKALKNKNYKVAVIKHSSKPIPREDSDTEKFLKEVEKVALITPERTEIMFDTGWDLKRVVPLLSADFLVIEGFKSLKYFPKIICLREEGDKESLSDGLELFSAGTDVSLKEKKIIDYLITEKNDLETMVEEIEKKSFLLPEENCGKCGYGDCYGLARAIVKGQETIEKCSVLQDFISIKINGKDVFINHFMSRLYQSLVYGMLVPLKDIDPLDGAKIEIKANLMRYNKQQRP